MTRPIKVNQHARGHRFGTAIALCGLAAKCAVDAAGTAGRDLLTPQERSQMEGAISTLIGIEQRLIERAEAERKTVRK